MQANHHARNNSHWVFTNGSKWPEAIFKKGCGTSHFPGYGHKILPANLDTNDTGTTANQICITRNKKQPYMYVHLITCRSKMWLSNHDVFLNENCCICVLLFRSIPKHYLPLPPPIQTHTSWLLSSEVNLHRVMMSLSNTSFSSKWPATEAHLLQETRNRNKWKGVRKYITT